MAEVCYSAEVPLCTVSPRSDAFPAQSHKVTLNDVANKLASLTADYNNDVQEGPIYETFRVKSRVNINMPDYLARIQRYTNFEEPIFVAALLQLERAVTCKPELRASQCIHKMQIASVTIASKTTDDDDYYMSDLAKIFGIEMNMLLKLEAVMLVDVLNFSAHVSDYQYKEYVPRLLELI